MLRCSVVSVVLAVQACVCAPADEHSAGRVCEIVHCARRVQALCVHVCVRACKRCVCVRVYVCVCLCTLRVYMRVCVCAGTSDAVKMLQQKNCLCTPFHVMKDVGVSGYDSANATAMT